MRELEPKIKKPKYLSQKDNFKHITTFIIFNFLLISVATCGCQNDLHIYAFATITGIFIIFAILKKLTENILLIGWVLFVAFFIILMFFHP